MKTQLVKIHVEIDLDKYRREYGDSTLTIADARKDVQLYAVHSITQGLRQFDYATVKEEAE